MKIKVDANGYVEGFVTVGDMDGAVAYTGEVPPEFNAETCRYHRLDKGVLALCEQAAQAEAERVAAHEEAAEIHEWFAWYDNQVMQYGRAQRLGEAFDHDMAELDAQAAQKQQRLRELNDIEGGAE